MNWSVKKIIFSAVPSETHRLASQVTLKSGIKFKYLREKYSPGWSRGVILIYQAGLSEIRHIALRWWFKHLHIFEHYTYIFVQLCGAINSTYFFYIYDIYLWGMTVLISPSKTAFFRFLSPTFLLWVLFSVFLSGCPSKAVILKWFIVIYRDF